MLFQLSCCLIIIIIIIIIIIFIIIIIIIIIFIMITIICVTQGHTAANALKLVALTVKQKYLMSPTKCFERDFR